MYCVHAEVIGTEIEQLKAFEKQLCFAKPPKRIFGAIIVKVNYRSPELQNV